MPAQRVSAGDADTMASDFQVKRYVHGAWGYSFEHEELNNDFKIMPTDNSNWGLSFGRVRQGTYQVNLLAGRA